MIKNSILLLIGGLMIPGSAFFFYQRTQAFKEASSLQLEHASLENEMNVEIQQAGQATEETRWQWIRLGDDKARAEYSAWKSGIYSLGCLVIASVAALLGIPRWRRGRSLPSTPNEQ